MGLVSVRARGQKHWAPEAVLLPIILWDLPVEPGAMETTGGLQAQEQHGAISMLENTSWFQ